MTILLIVALLTMPVWRPYVMFILGFFFGVIESITKSFLK